MSAHLYIEAINMDQILKRGTDIDPETPQFNKEDDLDPEMVFK